MACYIDDEVEVISDTEEETHAVVAAEVGAKRKRKAAASGAQKKSKKQDCAAKHWVFTINNVRDLVCANCESDLELLHEGVDWSESTKTEYALRTVIYCVESRAMDYFE